MTTNGLRSYIVKRLVKLNLRKAAEVKKTKGYIASYKNELHPCHSFRNFAVTQMARSRVDNVIRGKARRTCHRARFNIQQSTG